MKWGTWVEHDEIEEDEVAAAFTIGACHQTFSTYIFAATLDQFEDFHFIRYTKDHQLKIWFYMLK